VLFEYASDYLLTGSYDVQTPGYRAPEALLRCSFSENIDVWSIGVVLVELLMSERLVPEGAEDVQAVRVVGDGGSLLVSHLTSLTSHHTLYTSPINHQSPHHTPS
jgi:serine/threonine protein kinase